MGISFKGLQRNKNNNKNQNNKKKFVGHIARHWGSKKAE
jgi:hypothetical protein